jgi:hypothetical protein
MQRAMDAAAAAPETSSLSKVGQRVPKTKAQRELASAATRETSVDRPYLSTLANLAQTRSVVGADSLPSLKARDLDVSRAERLPGRLTTVKLYATRTDAMRQAAAGAESEARSGRKERKGWR